MTQSEFPTSTSSFFRTCDVLLDHMAIITF